MTQTTRKTAFSNPRPALAYPPPRTPPHLPTLDGDKDKPNDVNDNNDGTRLQIPISETSPPHNGNPKQTRRIHSSILLRL